MRRIAILVLLLVSCQSAAAPTPTDSQATIRLVAARQPALITPLPTQTPRSIWATRAVLPTPTITLPAPTATVIPTLPQMIFVTQIADTNVPTWTPPPSWTPPPPNPEGRVPEHFLLQWPVRAATFNRRYPYGGTDEGRLQVHHGDDLVNPLGTPIHAAGDGTVIYAGDDFTTRFGPENDYYGHLVVIQHNFFSPEGLPVFTLYGHMDQLGVTAGQSVHQGDVIGTVGETGIALGPHVHVEIRVGNPFDFGASRNPELWLQPPPNSGVLVGRVVDEASRLVYNVTITVQSSDATRKAFSYGDGSVNSDPALGENFTLGNLPPDYYVVLVNLDGVQRFARTIYVYPDQLNWLTIQLSP